MSEPMDYASAGVDIDLEGSAVASLIGALSKSVRAPGTPGAPVDLPGGFGGLIEFGDNLLALATDGVGSKLQIATALEQWGGVGIDCMAMNVNDLLCVGAEPIAFVDYVAVPKPDPAIHAALGASLAEACRLARVTLAGGETASLPGIVTELDLSGTALGWLPKGQAITGEHLKEGDVLIGLPASGIHSNGYSLVRKIIEHAGLTYTDTAPFEAEHPARTLMRWTEGAPTLGEILLNPTRIYCDPVVDLLNAAREERRFPSATFTASATSREAGSPTCYDSIPPLDGTFTHLYRCFRNSLGCKRQAVLRPVKCTGRSTWAWAWSWRSLQSTLRPFYRGCKNAWTASPSSAMLTTKAIVWPTP